ncbi:hypothetical protein LCGC14_2370370 [marine sediment metagenome]|uniref:Uncharacterized protein n=1 Tax=marine sediment metagenome TaxID=412755 RepID=A0A0F9C3Y3_9ZZZZ
MRTDLEASTFQKRPAYRYIRQTDKLPGIDPGWVNDPIAKVKLFNPTGAGTWYITAYDPESRTAYGRADIQYNEYGFISMAELVDYRGRFGLPIERDLSWTPKPLSKCA